MTKNIDLSDNDAVAIWAFRYCLGRRTYVVSDCVKWLMRNWDKFDPHVRDIVKNDLDDAFQHDDAARARGSNCPTLGDDCDRAEWEKVRALWGEK